MYGFLVLHALKKKLAVRKNFLTEEFETTDAATPEQITEWLWNNFYFFVNGNHTRVALKRLKDKGYVARDTNGLFSITGKGQEYYESMKEKVFNELSPIETRIMEYLYEKTKEWGHCRIQLDAIASELKIPFRTCLNSCIALTLKLKTDVFYDKDKYFVQLTHSELSKLKEQIEEAKHSD
jgi:hypothetical protein